MRILALICLALASAQALALDPSQLLSQYGHTAWRMQDGSLPAVPDPTAHGADGYLWIGTSSGLLRFDGVRFTPWVSEYGERLASNNVTALLATDNGDLWIGSEGGLDLLRDGHLKRISAEVGGMVADLYPDTDGKIWVLRTQRAPIEKSLCWITEERLQCPVTLEGLDLAPNSCCARAFARDDAGGIWFGGDVGLIHWQAGKTSVMTPAALQQNRGMSGVMAVASTKRGELWVASAVPGREGGLQRLVNGKLQSLVTPTLDTSSLSVYVMYLDSHDALWVGTADDGLLRIHGDRVERFRASDGLSSNTVLRIYEDREGNVWVSTVRGLDRFRELSVVMYSTREGLASDEVDGVLARDDGSIWVATTRGLNILRDGKVTTLDAGPPALRNLQITSLFEDSGGRPWVGAAQSMFVFDQGKFTPVEDAAGHPPGLVVGIAEDTERNIWMQIADRTRRLLRVDGTRIVEQFPDPQVPGGRNVAADPAGGVWIGTVNGDLAHYHAGRWEKFSFADVSPTIADRPVEDLIVRPDGAVIAGAGYGVIELDHGVRRVLDRNNGLPCDRIWAMQFDASDDLWLNMECGFVRIEKAELAAWRRDPSRRVAVRWLDGVDGAQTGRAVFTETARSTDGRLWFATINGLQAIDPARVKDPAPVPIVHVEEFLADRKKLSVRSKLVLPALTRDIEVDYTAPSLGAPQKLVFRYRLEGYEEQWQEVGARRQAFYNDLAPGNYRFVVTACNQDGACNEQGASVSFEVLPAFYQTKWFMVGVVLMGLLLLWLAFFVRLRQVSARFRSRLEASLEERERIARELHDTFLQGVQGLVLKFQSAMEKIPIDEPARQLMEKALDRADVVLAEGRDRVTALRHSTRAQSDFTAAVRKLIAQASADAAADIRLTVEGQPRALHPVIAEESLRILSEGLTNALRHANAKGIDVEILYSRRELVVRLVDDGRGFDAEVMQAAPAGGHWGLTGMRERAQKIKAQLEIASRTNAGTSIELRVLANIAYASEPDHE